MSESVVTDREKGVTPDSEWARMWRDGEADWHTGVVDPYLSKNGPSLFEDAKKRIFLPLCGKSPDLLWFYERGHEVVGVEIAEEPVQEFFQENGIQHSVEEIPNVGTLYKSDDGRLSIFAANIFNIPTETYGKFDIVWDNNSIPAINKSDRIRYRDMMYSVMKPDTVYYLMTLEYDQFVWPGPPHSMNDKPVEELFGHTCQIQLLEKKELKLFGKSRPKTEANDDDSVDQPKKETDNKPTKPLRPEQLALITSPFLFKRLYKMTFK